MGAQQRSSLPPGRLRPIGVVAKGRCRPGSPSRARDNTYMSWPFFSCSPIAFAAASAPPTRIRAAPE
eukprot:885705-Alexandrium_andersonii.AAC.1